MGVFLGQLPPAELARLKAELAETLIAHFCYPRFFDYRTESLRTRPVDRAKRQEVWLYLSSVDFTAWNRVDLMSPEFQHQVERLFIHFVQRNRSFFGEQGRKRMADIRMLISTSAQTVAQGLRNHLSGHPTNPPFGSPRPVISWSAPPVGGRIEPSWEQLAQSTLELQQQLQELRGEIKPVAQPAASAEVRSPVAPVSSRRMNRIQATSHTAKRPEVDIPASPLAPAAKGASASNGRTATPQAEPKVASVGAGWNAPAASVGTASKIDMQATSIETPVVTPTVVKSSGTLPPVQEKEAVAVASPPSTSRRSSQSLPAQKENVPVVAVDEDVAIFEQLRHQLIVWLRIEAVRSGLEIAGQSPSQLLEMLRQQENYDETRLQVVSTLLNLVNQVMRNGQASPFDYKQALMFHLMHTQR